MARYLFLNFPAAGHVNPTLAIVKELRSRGEQVSYALPEAWRGPIESLDAEFLPLPPRVHLEHSYAAAHLSPDERIALLPFAMAREAPQAVPDVVRIVQASAPDCLVINSIDVWGKLAARITGIRAVGFRPFHAPLVRAKGSRIGRPLLADLARQADRALEGLMASYRVPAVSLSELRSDVANPTLVFVPRAFQVGGDEFDERFVFVGPSLLEPAPLPADLPLRSDSRRVLISLGTLRNHEPDFYRLCLASFGGGERQVFMSIGRSVDPAELGPVPENFVVRPHLPQTSLLQHMDLFVSHGGLNSVMESLYNAVPLIVLPATREQRLTAERVEELHLGARDELHSITTARLASLARGVADDREMRRNLTAMRKITRESGGHRLAVDILMRAVGQREAAHPSEDLGPRRGLS